MDSFVILAYVAGPILLPVANNALRLGDTFPNFEANTTEGRIRFYDWLDSEKWAILFSHPADFLPVSTTELADAHNKFRDFERKNVRLIALSCDPIDNHQEWIKDILDFAEEKGEKFNFPVIADPHHDLAVVLGMLNPGEKNLKGFPLNCRTVFIVGPDHKLKLSVSYPATTGINFDEILRVIDSLQLTTDKKIATHANWKTGDKCFVLPTLSMDQARELFTKVEIKDVPSGKEYMRYTHCHQNK